MNLNPSNSSSDRGAETRQRVLSSVSRRRKTLVTILAVFLPAIFILFIWQSMTGFSAMLILFEHLSVTAPTTTLRVGESTQLIVSQKRALFFHRPLQQPGATRYFTVSEHELVVEPDGRVTCIGTQGLAQDVIWISADNAGRTGHISFTLLPAGPGPSLEFMTLDVPKPASVPDYLTKYAPCCIGDPVIVTEGQAFHYKLVRRGSSSDDLTAKAKYTLFFGSGIPNDARPSTVTGGHDYVTFQNFHIDPQTGAITAPPSIGRDNRERVVVFARYGSLIGWTYIIITHAEPGGRDAHLRLHPEEP